MLSGSSKAYNFFEFCFPLWCGQIRNICAGIRFLSELWSPFWKNERKNGNGIPTFLVKILWLFSNILKFSCYYFSAVVAYDCVSDPSRSVLFYFGGSGFGSVWWMWIFLSTMSFLCAQRSRVGKNPVFLKKNPSPAGFLCVFLCFFVFFVYFWFFLGFFADERVFRVFFSFTNTLRWIQTLNYNRSY